MLRHTSRAIGLDRPVLIGAATALAAVAFVAVRLVVVAHGDASRFIDVGSDFASPAGLPHGITIVRGSGYDGQFYYRLALDPADLHQSAFGIHMDNAYRVQRITYSVLAWLLAAGQARLIPFSLIAVNVLLLGLLGWLGAILARACGRHAAWGLLVAGYFGFLFTLGRDLTEICEACFVVLALLCLRRRWPVAAGLALAAAVLSRETALVVVGGVALVALAELVRRRRRPGRPDLAWVLPLVAYTGWQLVGWRSYGAIPFRSDSENNLTFPFVSLARAVAHNLDQSPNEHTLIWLAQLAVLATVAVTAACTLRASRAASREKCAWALAMLLALFLSETLWVSHADFRGFEDLYLLSVVVLLDSDRRLRELAVTVGTMWALTFVHRALYF